MSELIATPEIVAIEKQTPTAMTPKELLSIAVSQNADIDKLQKLMDLQDRYERNEARKAYVAAMKKFKENPPTITKNKHVHFETQKGPTDYDHATLDHVCDVITKGLSAVGITHSWKVKNDKEFINVTCVLTHEMGHSEETQLMGTPDDSGGKNKIQAIGSTVSYLSRYTLLAAVGMATKNMDTDGHTSNNPIVSVEELEKTVQEIAEAKSLETLKNIFAIGYARASDMGDKKAMAYYIQAKDKRKKELADAR